MRRRWPGWATFSALHSRAARLALLAMIPFGLKKDPFVTRCTRLLDKCAPRAIATLRELLAMAVPPSVTERA